MFSVSAMARGLDDRQQAELTDFVNALYDSAGYKTTAEWARDSGYAYPNLTNLRNGRGAVDGYNLLRLIRAAADRAELGPAQLAVAIERAQAAAAQGGDATTELRLEELSTLVAEALGLLRKLSAQQSPGEEPGNRAAR